MLRTMSGLSRPVLKWVSQVTASLGATLAATLIWSAVPPPGAAPAAVPAAQPELTSGGKFAARAVQSIAYDGLDTMPLPRVAPMPARFVPASLDVAPVEAAAPRLPRRAGWDGASAPERRAVRPARQSGRAEARRAEPVAPAAQATPPAAPPAPDRTAEDGFLHRMLPSVVPDVVSTAREAWTATASAGGALAARVMP